MPEGSPLVLPGRLGLIGDAHGNETFLANAIFSLVDAGAELLVQLGDFGVLFDGSAAEMAAVARIETLLGLVDRQLWVIPGNHDPYDLIAALPWGGSLSHASEHIAYVARGARARPPRAWPGGSARSPGAYA